MSVGPVPLAGGGIEVCYTNCICAMSAPVLPNPPSCGSCSQGSCGTSGSISGPSGLVQYPVLATPGSAFGTNSSCGGGTCGGSGAVLPMIALPGIGGAGGGNCNCGNGGGGADPTFGSSGTGYSIFTTINALGLGTGICAEYMNASAGIMEKSQIACVPKPGQYMQLWNAKPVAR